MYLVCKIHRINTSRIDGFYGAFDTLEEARKCQKENDYHAREWNGNTSCQVFETLFNTEDFWKAKLSKYENARHIYGFAPVTEVLYVPNSLKRVA